MTDWAEIYRSSYADVVRYLHRKVWDAERARDLAQEAFMRALHASATGALPVNGRAFVFRIAANLAHDEARMVVRRRRHLALLKTESDIRAEEGTADILERETQERAARAALEQLTDRDREVLLLWDAGLSYTEIAQQAGLAVGAIGTTLARARRKLVDAHAALEAKHAARG